MSNPTPQREATVPPVSGGKKSTSALLPAFEPFSSPALPRPPKRSRGDYENQTKYPTPLPTSSTHILTSSPTRGQVSRPGPTRSVSTLSERAPLASVPSIELHAEGRPTRFGRSSASCDYQLSSNRLISRVHVVATYKPAITSLDRERVEIQCTGWNGIKVHCQSKVFEVKKGETFTSDIRDCEIMLDVHETRIIVQWPEKIHLGPVSSDEEDVPSPSKKQRAMVRHSTPPSPSPIQNRRKPMSPISPTPAHQQLLPSSPPVAASRTEASVVEIFEDPDTSEMPPPTAVQADPSQSTQIMSQNVTSFASLESAKAVEDFVDDNDEENDPIVHSFGPFGANLQARLASITASDPIHQGALDHSSPVRLESAVARTSPLRSKTATSTLMFDVKSHVINQLAYSRLSSTPLSTILGNLPDDTETITKHELRSLIKATSCIGEVIREGKDAHGKPLESEYYYLPEEDDDEFRRAAVVNDLRKPGLRACRKQHKVCHA